MTSDKIKITKFKKAKKALIVGDYVRVYVSEKLVGDYWIDHKENRCWLQSKEKHKLHFRIINDNPDVNAISTLTIDNSPTAVDIPKGQIYFIINPRKMYYE